MPVITSIRRNVKNASRCSIFVDEAFLAACPIDVALAMGLRKGLELSPEMERQLRAEDRRIVFKQKAYRFSTYKPRTERQILQHLEKIGCVPEEIEVLLVWLREFRLIDDHAYAERFIAASKDRKPLSRNAARATLLRKGIPAELADTLLEADYSDDVSIDAARRVAEKKVRGLRATTDEERKQKLVRFMQYRGFSWDVIRVVVDDVLHANSQHGANFVLAFAMIIGIIAVDTSPSYAQSVTTTSAKTTSNAQSVTTCNRTSLPAAVNRYQPTTLPVVSHDGNTLFIDRKLHPDNSEGARDADDVWTSERLASGEWSSPSQKPLTTFRRPDVLFNFTRDGLHALVVGKYCVVGRDTSQCFAVISRADDTELFTAVEPIVLAGDTGIGKNFYGHLSQDRSTLFLALNRADSRGDMDLYVATKCNGSWERPVSLGSVVNTPSFEGSPWLGRDNRTLYFASSGRDDRRGKSDLYMSRRVGDSWTNWSEPENLGPCINTSEDETSLSVVNNSDTALITSWDFESERQSIYYVTLPTRIPPQPYVNFTAVVLDAVTGERLSDASMELIDSSESCEQVQRVAVRNGSASVVLEGHSRYNIRTLAEHYVPHEQIIGIRTIDTITPLTLTIRMFDGRRPLASVFFERGSSEVSAQQRAVLDSLIATYEVRNINFNVVGYTDEVGTRPFNQTLSSKRADAITAELLRLGIGEGRVSASGRGIEMLGMSTGLSENPQSRRVDVFPVKR